MSAKNLLAPNETLIKHLGINTQAFLFGFSVPYACMWLHYIGSLFKNLVFNYGGFFLDEDRIHLFLYHPSSGAVDSRLSRCDSGGSKRALWESGVARHHGAQ